MQFFRQLSIKSKLILMLLAISLASIILTAYIGYSNGKTNLTDRVFSQLTSLRNSKGYQIESYFTYIRNQTQSLAEDLMVINAVQEFENAYKELENKPLPDYFEQRIDNYYRYEFFPRLKRTETNQPILQAYTPENPAGKYLQYYYIAANSYPIGKKHLLSEAPDGSTYSKVHARYHPIFRNIIQRFGYYDIFLVDPDTGNIVYTVFKETDYTTSLYDGPYSDSNLARAVMAAKNSKAKDFIKIVDFAAYRPSYGAPAAFIAAPIFSDADLIGILAFQMPVDQINNVMTSNYGWEKDGLGNTGETYLIGQDFLMRSISRLLVENPKEYVKKLQEIGVNTDVINRIENFKTSILEVFNKTEASQEALLGKSGTKIITDYRGEKVLSSFAPLKIDDLDWAVVSQMDLPEAYAPIDSFSKTVIISASFMMIIVTLIAMALAYFFVNRIKILIATAKKIAGGSTEIDHRVFEAEDEFGELARAFNLMVKSLQQQTQLVEDKNRENEELLLSVFPASVAKRLKQGEKDIAESVSNVSVVFSEVTGFNQLSESMTAYELVSILNDLVTSFDEASERHGMEKIKTMGESYMAVCGLSVPYLDHDKRALDLAIEIMMIVRRFKHERELPLDIKIAVNVGDVVAGIVGRNKFIYDVWGDTINLATAMKSNCKQGQIIVSELVYERLRDIYDFEKMIIAGMETDKKIVVWRLKQISRDLVL